VALASCAFSATLYITLCIYIAQR